MEILQRSETQIIEGIAPIKGWSCLHGNRADSIRISNRDFTAAGRGSTGHPI